MKKVLILGNSSGGLYDFRNELVLRLLQQTEVVISLPDDVRTKELSEEGCRIVRTQMNRRGVNPKEDLSLLFSYRRLLKEEKPDLVLTYTIKPNIYGGFCCRMMHIPYMETVTGLGSSFEKEGFLKKMIVTMYRTALKRAACIFFQNAENRQIFADYRIKGKKAVLVSGSGVNLKRHTFEPYPEGEETIFLYVGRMMREKGVLEILEAAKKLREESDRKLLHAAVSDKERASGSGAQPVTEMETESGKIRFQLLGYPDDDLGDMLQEYADAGYIELLPFDPDVHSYLKAASALVLPSYHEGMSNVLMEASATGRPVIATNISGCREVFEEGVTGFGCEKESTGDLIRALRLFLARSREERAEMGRRAREKMEREFDREKVADAYMQVIQNILHEEKTDS